MNAPTPFDARLARLHAAMDEAGVAAYVCDHAEMLAWLTGYSVSETRYRACIVSATGAVAWVLRTIDEGPCKAASWVEQVYTVADNADPHQEVARVIANVGAASGPVGADFESYGFTAATHARLAAELPSVRWVDMPGISNSLRSIKDASELQRLSAAAEIADRAMAAVVAATRPGLRPRDVAAVAAAHYLRNGADDWWVGPISISRHASEAEHEPRQSVEFLHRSLDDTVLHAGDVLHAELVPKVGGYSARMMRSISVGPASRPLADTAAQLVALQDAQIESMHPGARASDVDAVLRDALVREGLRTRFDNVSGYQLGLYARSPRSSDFSLCFHPGACWQLAAGMVFHMYASAMGLAISDPIAVSSDGARRLTTTPRRLLESPAA